MKNLKINQAINYESVLCPICDSNNNHRLFEVSQRIIVECNNCGHEYVNPVPLFSDRDNYFFLSFETDALNTKIDITYINKVLRKYHLINCKVLDLGCGQGRLEYGLIQAGWNQENLYLMDKSKSSLDVAKKMCESVNIIAKDLDEGIGFTNYFDCILMVEFFEDLIHPRESLQIVLDALKEEGLLIIRGLPNNRSFESFLGQERWKMRTFEKHYSFFNPHTFVHFTKHFPNMEILEFGCFLQEGYSFYDIARIGKDIGIIKGSIGTEQYEMHNGKIMGTDKLIDLILTKIRSKDISDYYYSERLPKQQLASLSDKKDIENFFDKIHLDYLLSPDFSVVTKKCKG